MKQIVREFLEQEEAVSAARSKEVRRAKARKRRERMAKWIEQKALNIEMSGNPAGAEQYRNFWRALNRRSGNWKRTA